MATRTRRRRQKDKSKFRASWRGHLRFGGHKWRVVKFLALAEEHDLLGRQPGGVEINQFQVLLAEQIQLQSYERRVHMPMYGITNTVNKVVRIRRITPLLAQHKLKFKRDSRGARLLVEQLRDFPNGDHDDGPDALEMALRLTAELRAEIETESLTEIVICT
jgi:predicted phage terminase large subunit-like protein